MRNFEQYFSVYYSSGQVKRIPPYLFLQNFFNEFTAQTGLEKLLQHRQETLY